MGLVVRIVEAGSMAVSIHGLTTQQQAVVRDFVRALDGGISISFQPTRDGKEARLTASPERLQQLPEAFRTNEHIPPDLPAALQSLLDNYLRTDQRVSCKGQVLDLGSRTHIMGILNVTPDSFSDGGRHADTARAITQARLMAAQGADIIDVGGESTRPGAEPVSEDEELRRIIPVIERLASELTIPISVDTYKSRVARKALEAGASIVNDVSGLRFSLDMAGIVAEYGAAVVIMHIKGTPRDMQQDPVYTDVVAEVKSYLADSIALAVQAGVNPESILVDPGIGFGKTLEHNLTLLNRLGELRGLGCPILLGTSRKKFIGTVLGIAEADRRQEGTAATIVLGIERGARVMRVHDVAQMVKVARMTDAVLRTNTQREIQNSK
jgi:dihydropteroate synthase